MAYYSGVANDMAAVRQALVDACVGEGWVWNQPLNILSKGVVYVELLITNADLLLRGFIDSNKSLPTPWAVRMGELFRGNALLPIIWPVKYEIFLFDDEAYTVINYSDTYQWAAFGHSSISLPGTGMWIGATCSEEPSYVGNSVISLSSERGGGNQTSGALFLTSENAAVSGRTLNSFVQSSLSGNPWYSNGVVGIAALSPLLGNLPNAWNSESVLLPIREYAKALENKISLVADLKNARHVRIDNYDPGQIVSIGSDKWKVFPWLRKNTVNRQGTYNGSSVRDSGTLGWAIRYDGP